MIENLLYIGEEVQHISTGADAVNLRNYEILKHIFKEHFYHYPLKYENKFITFYNLLLKNCGIIKSSDYSHIIQNIKKNHISSIFLWSSKLGKLASILRREFPNVRIITFFHNIEKQYYSESLKFNSSLKNKFIASCVSHNEFLAVKNSDIVITLNNRDTQLLKDIYCCKSTFELPISFKDRYNQEKESKVKASNTNKRQKLLFVGSNFFGNNIGLDWFLREVMPNLTNVELTIAGKGMSSRFKSDENIQVFDYVSDLSELYYSTDVVIAPIFNGGGMKTKIAEAIMYGCPIIGTKESFEGYNFDYNRIGGISQTPQEMVDTILRLKDTIILQECRKYAREIYLNNYSFESSLRIMRRHLL